MLVSFRFHRFNWRCFGLAVIFIRRFIIADGGKIEGLLGPIGEGTGKTNPLGGGCFTAGTLVPTLKMGKDRIEEIKVGDYVWSENPEKGEKRLKKVVKTFIHD